VDRIARRGRLRYVTAIAVTVAAGLLSRSSVANHLPWLLRTYAGDTLWALAVFLTLGLLFPRAGTLRLALGAAILSYGVEISQLYQASWLNGIRHTTGGALLLGFGFRWSDLVCYSLGILLGVAAEYAGLRPAPRGADPAMQRP